MRFLAWKYGSFQLPLQRWGISTQWHHITHFVLLNIYQGLEDQGAPAASIVLVSGCFTECRMEYLMIVQKSSRSLCSSGTTYQMFMVLFSGLSSRKSEPIVLELIILAWNSDLHLKNFLRRTIMSEVSVERSLA